MSLDVFWHHSNIQFSTDFFPPNIYFVCVCVCDGTVLIMQTMEQFIMFFNVLLSKGVVATLFFVENNLV